MHPIKVNIFYCVNVFFVVVLVRITFCLSFYKNEVVFGLIKIEVVFDFQTIEVIFCEKKI